MSVATYEEDNMEPHEIHALVAAQLLGGSVSGNNPTNAKRPDAHAIQIALDVARVILDEAKSREE